VDGSEERIRLVVEIDQADDADGMPHGRVDGGDGTGEDFHGWTSLAAAIERRRSVARAEPPPDPPG
jgi:hypothetical protein